MKIFAVLLFCTMILGAQDKKNFAPITDRLHKEGIIEADRLMVAYEKYAAAAGQHGSEIAEGRSNEADCSSELSRQRSNLRLALGRARIAVLQRRTDNGRPLRLNPSEENLLTSYFVFMQDLAGKVCRGQ